MLSSVLLVIFSYNQPAGISMLMWMRIRGVSEDRFPPMTKILHAVSWIIPTVILFLIVVSIDHEETINW